MERSGIRSKECCRDVPELIDFFKSEMPLRGDCHMGKQEDLCRPGSQQWSNPATSPERAIAECEERHLEPLLVEFFEDGTGDLPHFRRHDGVEATVINRSSSSAVEAKPPPRPKLSLEIGEPWSVQAANPLQLQTLKMVFSPTSTVTEESGTAAPKTPTCDLEIAYRRPDPADHNESSAYQGSTIVSHVGCSKLSGGEVCADSGTSSSHGRDRRPPEGEDEENEETEAVVQAATSLLSLASHENTPPRRRRRPSEASSGSPVEWDREFELDEAGRSSVGGACASVLYRPTNKRRYKRVVDLLTETPPVW